MSSIIQFDYGEDILILKRTDLKPEFYQFMKRAKKLNAPNKLTATNHQQLGSSIILYCLYWFLDYDEFYVSTEADEIAFTFKEWSAMTVGDLKNTLAVVNNFYIGSPQDLTLSYRKEEDDGVYYYITKLDGTPLKK